ncbi:MAG: hypothetical protein ACK5CW_12295 [Verrucomicrobiota bacterium]|jgi:hypothetical protein
MSFEIIYQSGDDGKVHWLYEREWEVMRESGLAVALEPSSSARSLLRRGLIMWEEEDYPSDPRYLQGAEAYRNFLRIDRWYPIIEPLTIPTVFCAELGASAERLIREQGWRRAFIKDRAKSLVEEDPLESTWPDVSFASMVGKFAQWGQRGPYALRQYLPPDTFAAERRYWVMGKAIHHSSGIIPEIVREAADRLSVLGGIFYTIDATPELIVELNPGESSDRKTNNSAEDFARWIRLAFAGN